SMKLQVPGKHGYHSTGSQDKGTVAVSRRSLEGPPADPAADHIPDLAFPPVGNDDVVVNPRWGVPASTTRLLLGVERRATGAQAAASPADADVTSEGGLPEAGILLVTVPPYYGIDRFANVTAALGSLRSDPAVDFAAMSLVSEAQSVPRG